MEAVEGKQILLEEGRNEDQATDAGARWVLIGRDEMGSGWVDGWVRGGGSGEGGGGGGGGGEGGAGAGCCYLPTYTRLAFVNINNVGLYYIMYMECTYLSGERISIRDIKTTECFCYAIAVLPII